MESWIYSLISAIGAGGLGISLFDIFYVRPKLKEANAGANKAETEAADAKISYLVERIEKTEQMYNEQGKLIDELRGKVIQLTRELQAKEEKLVGMEAENGKLKQEMTQLKKEVEAYKTITHSSGKKK